MSDTKKTPVEAEAADDATVLVEWRDLSFEVPRDRADWPVRAEFAARDNDAIGFVRAIMPADKFAQLADAGTTNREIAEISDAIVAALGFADTGESPASSD